MDEIDGAFLVEAEKLLQEGKSREAAELCTRGLVKYPEYYTAYAVLIRALDEMGDYVQMQEVYDSAPNVIKLNVKNDRLSNTQSTPESKKNAPELESEDIKDEDVESDSVEDEKIETTDVIEEEENSEDESVIDETEVDDPEEQESNEPDEEDVSPDLEIEINQALKNDELTPEVVSDLTKSEKEEQEEIDIKETLTLAKIYEQQDAFSEALIIYKQLQEITADKSKYADKILELQTLVDEEKK
jgi:tetratricopeptide (TPR) repeat protein